MNGYVAAHNDIHPTACVDASVVIGAGNVVGAYTVISGEVTIGDGNWIGPHVTIGSPAQFSTRKFEITGAPCSGVSIGSRNVIREYCTVHQPSLERTIIEDDCYLMAYCHVSHDSRICTGAVLANNTQLGGFTEIGRGANIGLSTVAHQFTTVGAFAMVGMSTVLTKNVPPFCKVVGTPARFVGINEIGMERAGFTAAEISAVRAHLRGEAPLTDEQMKHYFSAFRDRSERCSRGIVDIAP